MANEPALSRCQASKRASNLQSRCEVNHDGASPLSKPQSRMVRCFAISASRFSFLIFRVFTQKFAPQTLRGGSISRTRNHSQRSEMSNNPAGNTGRVQPPNPPDTSSRGPAQPSGNVSAPEPPPGASTAAFQSQHRPRPPPATTNVPGVTGPVKVFTVYRVEGSSLMYCHGCKQRMHCPQCLPAGRRNYFVATQPKTAYKVHCNGCKYDYICNQAGCQQNDRPRLQQCL